MSYITLENEGELAIITLDNPPQNRIGERVVAELATVIQTIEAGEFRAVLLRAKGENFCFGGDIADWPDMSSRQLRALFDYDMSIFNRFERLPLPVVAAVQGLCFGGGLELAIRADMIVAAESARFGHPEQTLGIVTLLGGIYRVAERAGRSFASEWALTSEPISAATMMQHGVVNRVVPDADLDKSARQLAARAATGATRAYAAHKALLRIWAEAGVAAADSAMFDIAMPLFETEDVRRGLASAVGALKAGRSRPVLDYKGR
ncbi:MAG TPA: enoyl-CoA hydratase/isomerase family protein [Steroidobacteraceae bacterium]